MSRAIDVDRLTRKPVRRDCRVCSGHGTVSIRRGDRAEILMKCFKCSASYAMLARAFNLPTRSHRTRRSPIREANPVLRWGLERLQEEADRRARRDPADRDYIAGCGEVRHEMNTARLLRSLATRLGDCPMTWDFLEEAAQREQRARCLVLELDDHLARQNATLMTLATEMTA